MRKTIYIPIFITLALATPEYKYNLWSDVSNLDQQGWTDTHSDNFKNKIHQRLQERYQFWSETTEEAMLTSLDPKIEKALNGSNNPGLATKLEEHKKVLI